MLFRSPARRAVGGLRVQFAADGTHPGATAIRDTAHHRTGAHESRPL